jgi:PAS domain S-box-containing protein
MPSAAMTRSDVFVRSGVAAVALFGLLVIVAWYAHWTAFLQISPDSAAVKYNAGLVFILCSVGIALLSTRFARPAVACGALAIVIGTLTLFEYLTASSFSIDQIFVRDYIFSTGDFPGRMSQLTAGCYILLGTGVVVAAAGDRTRLLVVIAALACVVALIATFALFGYAFGIEEAYGWGADTRMAAPTAAALLILSISFLEWARLTAQRRNFDLTGWLPIVGSVTLMTMVAFVSCVSMVHLKNFDDWRNHTYEVLLSAQTVLGEIADIQRGAGGYVLTGQREALEPYWTGIKDVPLKLAELRALTRDNASHNPQLDRLATDVADLSSYAKRLIKMRESAGIKAAVRLESTREGRLVANRTRADMKAFTDAEHRLLFTRTQHARDTLSDTTRFLVLASIFAAALLLWAHFSSSRQVRRRRRAEAALSEISTLQTAILNAADQAIISSSADGLVTTFNATAERWLGYAAADIIGKPAPADWYDAEELRAREQAVSAQVGHPVAGVFETLSARARLGQLEEDEWTVIRKDGSRFPAWRSVTAQIDAGGAVAGYLSVITDITERKEQEAEIRLGEERFRRAFDDAPIGMALVSPTGRWLKVNRALCSILGYSGAELLRKDVQSVTHRNDRASSEELVRQAIAGKDPPHHIEKRYVRRDGSLVFASLSLSLVRDSSGEPLYFISQVEDITERREVDRMKSEFISTVSHELRTPLTSIRGALGLIDAGVLGQLPEMAESMVKIAHQNSERLVRIINDILDVEKISAGKLELQIEDVPIAELLEQALETNQPHAVKHGVRFVLEAIPADTSVIADPDRLLQVMANLLSNAAKFSPHGAEVRVRASHQGMRLRVEIEDHGTGIPEAFRGRVFERFAQADSSTSRHFAGTGLGLSITRELVKAMGGTIGFTTLSGYGTTFHFELPRAGQTLQLPQDSPLTYTARTRMLSGHEESTPLRKCTDAPRILHVEDDIDLGHVINAALAGRAELVTADTLQAAERLLREESFSLLVLDLGLPDGNGLSLLEQLPALTTRPIPVVILSATEVSQEVRQRVAAVLVKSRVSEARIVTTILSLLPRTVNGGESVGSRQAAFPAAAIKAR